jgi:hypothetical protein
MDWWDVLLLLGLSGATVGVVGAVLTLVRQLPWRKDWHVGGYH